jgi:hypothetical protein
MTEEGGGRSPQSGPVANGRIPSLGRQRRAPDGFRESLVRFRVDRSTKPRVSRANPEPVFGPRGRLRGIPLSRLRARLPTVGRRGTARPRRSRRSIPTPKRLSPWPVLSSPATMPSPERAGGRQAEAMKRRAKASRKSAKSRPDKSSKLQGRPRQRPPAKRGSASSAPHPEIAQLKQDLHEAPRDADMDT